MMNNELRQEDGSYIFPNITAADSAYASGDGIEYYCTATNDFGTIRSRTVRAFYAGERERRDRETGWGAISGSWNVPIIAKVPSILPLIGRVDHVFWCPLLLYWIGFCWPMCNIILCVSPLQISRDLLSMGQRFQKALALLNVRWMS